jgi:hypothetical protein
MREFEQTLEFAQAVMDYAEKHEFKIWTAVGACLRAACIAALGNPVEGLTLIQKGMDMYQGLNSPPIFWPLLRALQAQIYGLAGKAEQGLTFIDESIAIPMPGYGNVMLAEFYLVKGKLMLLCFPDKPAEAEKWFRQALDTAQVVKASTFELRAAINLTRLWMHTDKENSGRKILEEVYNKFTEGFTMPDLQEAQQLLGKM